MYGVAVSGVCCCFSCCCQDCIDGLKRWLSMQKVTKIFYFFLITIFTVPAIAIFFFLNKWKQFITYFQNWISCPTSSGEEDLGCIGQSVVFRMSLALLILFTLMFVIMLFRTRLSMILNQGCFCVKYLIVTGIFIGFLWVNKDVFNNYAQFSKYASIVYMVLQSIILIDLFYLAGIKLVRHYDEGETQYACYLIILSILFQAVAVGLNVYGYILFRGDWYGSTLWVNIITTIMLIILPIIQLLHFNKQNSLVTTALVSLFISYLTFIAQFSWGVGGVRMTVASLAVDIICSTFFFILTMYGSIMGGTGQVKVTRNGNINQAMGVASTQPNQAVGEEYVQPKTSKEQVQTEQTNQLKYTESWQWAKWHFYMCIAAIYLAMLITNWISVDVSNGAIQQSPFGFWVRVIISWLTFLLYIWTMIAPRVCPTRDFTVV